MAPSPTISCVKPAASGRSSVKLSLIAQLRPPVICVSARMSALVPAKAGALRSPLVTSGAMRVTPRRTPSLPAIISDSPWAWTGAAASNVPAAAIAAAMAAAERAALRTCAM